MGNKSGILWSEGTFVKPQHFQQQQRHIEHVLRSRINALNAYFYGLSQLNIDRELLKLGRIGLSYATGVMPDGTFFEIPYQDLAPKPLEIGHLRDSASRDIYLALPITNDAVSEVDTAQDSAIELARYKMAPLNVRDLYTKGGGFAEVSICQLSPKLMQGSDNLSSYTSIPICRIKEQHSDGTLILDETFIPCSTEVSASPHLQKFLEEIAGLIAERARLLSGKIGSPTQQGVSGVAEFLMLQLLNRSQPLYQHLSRAKAVHPVDFYTYLTQTCGELMTFTSESRTATLFAPYNHEDLSATFNDLMISTRQALSIVLTPRAVLIDLHAQANGVQSGVINDSQLLKTADFVLAVKAQLPQEQLIRLFVQQTKISSPTRLQELVHIQIPGIPLSALSAAPPQLPFHAGYTYFQLDTTSAEWAEILKTNSIAFHVSGNFPSLDMQLWAVRSK